MKRVDLIRHIQRHGCELLREGAEHTIFVNRAEKVTAAVPRHREISDILARKIMRSLKVPTP